MRRSMFAVAALAGSLGASLLTLEWGLTLFFPLDSGMQVEMRRQTIPGIQREIVEKYPWVPINLYHAFNEAKALAMARMENPRIVPLAWYREAWEEQEEIMGRDPWEYGLGENNRKQLEILVGYSHEQGLIKRRMPLDELFLNVFQGRKRGDEFRI